MSHPHPTSVDQRIAEEAAQWLIDLDDGTADLPRFTAWLAASPRHVEELLLASAVWKAADEIDRDRKIDVEQLIRGRSNVEPFESMPLMPRASAPARRRSMLLGWASAAAAVLTLACLFWIGLADRPLQFATAVGEQRAFKLQDGSVVTLNTRSRVAVRFADTERTVDLAEGEALFDVEHDPARPFRVLAGGVVVQAVGTQFNVRRASDGTVVSVVEGIVQVSTLPVPSGGGSADDGERLIAGEQVRVSSAGELVRTAGVEIDRIMAWRERKLIFRDEPLADIVAEFNRYNDTQLIVEGTAIRERRITGVFNADDPGALVAFLSRDSSLSVQSREDGIVIRGP